MAYLGKDVIGILSHNKVMDTMTGDGSDTTLTLSRTPGAAGNVEVYLDGIYQTPNVEYTLSGNTITFTTAPATSTKVVAIVGNDSVIISPATNSISGTKIVDGAVTDVKIASGITSSKLTGALPALNGSALTNVSAGFTKNASDPTISTNPSGGVGTVWINTTSGEGFICTDATAGENVWTNIGAGSGDVAPFQFQGTISGYTFGSNVQNDSDIVDKFSLTTDGNATNVATLSVKRLDPAEAKSSTHGYAAGGWDGSTFSNIIDKFTFASDNDATDHGDITVARYYASGNSSSTHGYMSGGHGSSPSLSAVIDKWSTSSNSNATFVGNLTAARHHTSAQNSETHGYTSSGGNAPYHVHGKIVDRFAFASDDNAEDHGDLISGMNQTAGQSSETHGYVSGGYENASNYDSIVKFAFASMTVAVDHGDLSAGVRYNFSGSSSTTHGYNMGGQLSNAGQTVNIIDKFLMASNANATDVGDLSTNKCQTGSTQN